ncbi:MAG: HAD-IA family hydrolase [Proteobacteria bacterium]|nr:HAD-IA family hydrolase [Pseudomonadota bacterium]
MQKDFLVFDLDGTLVDSSGDIAWVSNRVLSTLGKEAQSVESVRSKIGSGVRVLLERLLPGADTEEIEEARILFMSEYSGHTVVETELYAGVAETLAHFSALGKGMAIVTNKPEVLAHPILAKLGIADNFSLVVGGDTYEHRKPHPEPLARAIESLGADIGRTVYIGDSQIDAETGRAVGTYTVGVGYGFGGTVEEVEASGFDTVIESFVELKSLIK